METIALRALEDYVRTFMTRVYASDGSMQLRHMADIIVQIESALNAVDAIRRVDEATDVGDEGNPLIKR